MYYPDLVVDSAQCANFTRPSWIGISYNRELNTELIGRDFQVIQFYGIYE